MQRKWTRIAEKALKIRKTIEFISNEELKKISQNILINEKNIPLEYQIGVVSEAIRRFTGYIPYKNQIIGAQVLKENMIAEMATGEGKTITAVIGLYLHVVSGHRVMLFTQNDYLAKRDYDFSKDIFSLLGVKTELIKSNESKNGKLDEKINDRQKRYNVSIVYTTNEVFGFEYLLSNLVSDGKEKLEFHFDTAIVDEIDSILLDDAQNPLIISGNPKTQSNYFNIAHEFVSLLDENIDFEINSSQSSIWLLRSGIKKAEIFFRTDKLFSFSNFELVKHILISLRVEYLMQKGEDYIVVGDSVKLIDNVSGRVLEGSLFEDGIQQAIETKENVSISRENRSMASVTFQHLFRKFKNLSGMTGTAYLNRNEFINVYNLKVIRVKRNRTLIRDDLSDQYHITLQDKMYAIKNRVENLIGLGRSVLLITESIDSAEIYSKLFWLEGIKHSVLTASQSMLEAEIIKQAGKKGAVTIATVIAGRGTDIKIDHDVEIAGGLAVIITEHFKLRRIDLQVMGRSGRQGENGTTEFHVSLEDKIFQEYPFKYLEKIKNKHKNITKLDKFYFYISIKRAQSKNKEKDYLERFNNLQMDETLHVQRELVYDKRNQIIQRKDVSLNEFKTIIIKIALETFQNIDDTEQFVMDYIDDHLTREYYDEKIIEQMIIQRIDNIKQLVAKNPEVFDKIVNQLILKAIDTEWVLHVDRMQKLRLIINKRSFVQLNPLQEYQRVGQILFEKYQKNVKMNLLMGVMRTRFEKNDNLRLIFPY